MAGRPNEQPTRGTGSRATRPVYPFTAIVGQEEMKLALLLERHLARGRRRPRHGPPRDGEIDRRARARRTAPAAHLRPRLRLTTATRATLRRSCADCRRRLEAGERLKREQRPVPVVELPLGATEDRVCGTIDIGRALSEGVKAFEPGLLARANRGFLYIDEVNLLEDHLVDLLLDAAATGTGRVEREGVSAEHPARFVLVGSGNPEEGELRPQLLDRFGTSVEVRTILDPDRARLDSRTARGVRARPRALPRCASGGARNTCAAASCAPREPSGASRRRAKFCSR